MAKPKAPAKSKIILPVPANAYRDKQWLIDRAQKDHLSYPFIAQLTDTSRSTVVKWMVKHGVFTLPPKEIETAFDKKSSYSGCTGGILLMGNPTVKKNSNTTAKGMRLPNKLYAPYEEYNVALLSGLKEQGLTMTTPTVIKFLFYRQNHVRCDISNLYEAPQDVMVKAGILPDDNCTIVLAHHSHSRVLYDNLYPRTEIYFYDPAFV